MLSCFWDISCINEVSFLFWEGCISGGNCGNGFGGNLLRRTGKLNLKGGDLAVTGVIGLHSALLPTAVFSLMTIK